MKQLRAVLIALALCLVCLAPAVQEAMGAQEASRAPREGANPEDLSREAGQGAAGTDKATAGNQQHAPSVCNPDAIICAVSVHNAPPGTTIPIPPGRAYTDFCPEARLVRAFYYNRPGAVIHLPEFSTSPDTPSPRAPKDTGGGP